MPDGNTTFRHESQKQNMTMVIADLQGVSVCVCMALYSMLLHVRACSVLC